MVYHMYDTGMDRVYLDIVVTTQLETFNGYMSLSSIAQVKSVGALLLTAALLGEG